MITPTTTIAAPRRMIYLPACEFMKKGISLKCKLTPMRRKWLFGIPLILLATYFLGPSPSAPVLTKELPKVPPQPDELEGYISSIESVHKLKPDNEARIIWADNTKKEKTPFSIVYLHGFSASQGEGEPVHRDIAKHFGYNLYLPRLAEHGIDT